VQVRDVSGEVIDYLNQLGIEVLVCIGGDGTMTISSKLAAKGVAVIGIPKTIDNDLVGTDITFGYDSAMTIAAEAIDRIHTTAQSHHRVMLIEIMGRYAGWLTLGAGIAGGADVILLPEIEYDLDVICAKVKERSHKGRRFSIIAVAEGAKPRGGDVVISRVVKDSPDQIRLGGIALKLGNDIEDLTGLATRTTVLGHLQRGGSPTAFDRVLATRYGVAAADLIARGRINRMVALRGRDIDSVPIEEVGGKTRLIPMDSPLLEVARAVGTNLGV
jgi:6-phosphofructokinase 1